MKPSDLDDLDNKNLGELKKIAKTNKVKGYTKYKKSDIRS